MLFWFAIVIFLGSFHSPEVIFEQVSVAYAMPRCSCLYSIYWQSKYLVKYSCFFLLVSFLSTKAATAFSTS